MNGKIKYGKLSNPKFQGLSTFLWDYLIHIIIELCYFPLDLGIHYARGEFMILVLQAYPSWAIVIIFGNLIGIGLLPIIYTIFNKENMSWYGLTKAGLKKSIGLGLLITIGYYTVSILLTGQLLGNFYPIEFNTNCALSRVRCIRLFFTNITFSAIGAFSYGPIEVFVGIWLMFKLDQIFQSEDVLLSKGVIVGVLLYGLGHLLTSFIEGLLTTILFFAFAMIYKLTNNTIGPMIVWMLIHELNWFMISIILTIA